MDRRTFNKLAGFGAVSALTSQPSRSAEPSMLTSDASAESVDEPHGAAHIPSRAVDWPSTTYRRLLVDTHVPDWDDRLLASFDAVDYVETIANAGFQSLMQYANSHVGLSLWRTKIGQMHRNMKGRDYFGEVMEQCRRHGLHRLAYYSLIFDDWAYRTHPDWRSLPEDGADAQLHSRTGTVCVNSPYRQHALACLRELVGNYDFECIFLDMTFWPTVCYCPYCTARYWKERGVEPPRIVDWKDSEWRTFQKSRERWLREFVEEVMQAIKQTRPIQVYHQCSTIFFPWALAVTLEQFQGSDFCGGDFYGGAAEFSLVCKAYAGLTRTRPFEFMTCRTIGLGDFETTKPFEQLALESMIPMVHSSACLLIDAINPTGTLNHKAYEFLSQINALHDPYEPFLGGDMQADVAIYFDRNSMYDPESNGRPSTDETARWNHSEKWNLPHLKATVGAARILREAHIPFGVVTNASLHQLSGYRAVILPNVIEMTSDQASAFREFVHNGGILYASGRSSMSAPEEGKERFLLGDVLGVRYLGMLGSQSTYLSTQDKELTAEIWPQESLGFGGPMIKVQAEPSVEVLATVTLPFVDPEAGTPIGTRFTQIWSNPPAPEPGEDPGIVTNTFGKGKAIWAATPVECHGDPIDARILLLLLKRFLQPPYKFEADTHKAVEVTLFHQEDRQRLLVGMLNLQEELPTIPVTATMRVRMPEGRRVKRVSLLPEQKDLPHSGAGPYISFQVPSFKLVSMALVEYV
jgi:hypothetical protein